MVRLIILTLAVFVAGGGADARAAEIVFPKVEARRGETVQIDATLRTRGDEVAGTENVLAFDSEVQVAECRVNPAIRRNQGYIGLVPDGCQVGECSGLKALVLSFFDLSPLPDRAVLYSCSVRVSPTARLGRHRLRCKQPGAADPDGTPVDLQCISGEVVVVDAPPVPTEIITPKPTRTPFPTPLPIATPTWGFEARPTLPPTAADPIFIETDFIELSSQYGGAILIRAQVFDEAGTPAAGVTVSFGRNPEVGLMPIFEDTTRHDFGRIFPETVPATILLEVEPDPGYTGEIAITAEAPPRRATTFVRIVPEPSERWVQSVEVRIDADPDRGGGNSAEVTALVLDNRGEPLDGVPVLFRSEMGIFAPAVVETTSESGFDGEARTRLDIPADAEPRRNPETGAIVPYRIAARAGTVTTYSDFVIDEGGTLAAPEDSGRSGAIATGSNGCAVATGPGNAAPVWVFLLLAAIVRRHRRPDDGESGSLPR